MLYLSKSKYCNAVQCPKMEWMNRNMKDKYDDSVMNEAILDEGSKVGDLAMGYFGDFVEIPYCKGADKSPMIEATKAEMEKGTPVICEASFSYQGLFCSVDILKKAADGSYEIYEVKSSTKKKSVFEDDIAYQYYVLTKLGVDVSKTFLMHMNPDYIRQGELDLNQLFVTADVTKKSKKKFDEVAENITFFEKYMRQIEEPECPLGAHCLKPYKCGYFGYCSRDLPKPNPFDIASMWPKDKEHLYSNGIITFEEIYNYGEIDPKFMIQVEHEVNDLPPRIIKSEIKKLLDSMTYPIYFLDFESYSEAVPSNNGQKPYQQMAFQYSLHIMHEDGTLEHKEYLSEPCSDPRRGVAEQLCADIPMGACSVAYNMSFERSVIEKMALIYLDLEEHLMSLHANMKDLMIPFKNKDYYERALKGSYSIKAVLPTLFPNDPELDYSNLPGVKKGDQASNAFIEMMTAAPEEVERLRYELLEYCKLDTYAMVKVWQKLKEVTE